MNYYIADTHFGHRNVIDFDIRPFADIEEMDRTMIANWNNRVSDNDDVYIIGDFVYRADKSVAWYCNQLHGRKHLILGNHDKLTDEDRNCFVSVDKMLHITDGNNQICACHFPIAEWNGFHKGHYHIYGHIHNKKDDTFEFMKKRERALNAGCMINNYEPVLFQELIDNNKSRDKQEKITVIMI